MLRAKPAPYPAADWAAAGRLQQSVCFLVFPLSKVHVLPVNMHFTELILKSFSPDKNLIIRRAHEEHWRSRSSSHFQQLSGQSDDCAAAAVITQEYGKFQESSTGVRKGKLTPAKGLWRWKSSAEESARAEWERMKYWSRHHSVRVTMVWNVTIS